MCFVQQRAAFIKTIVFVEVGKRAHEIASPRVAQDCGNDIQSALTFQSNGEPPLAHKFNHQFRYAAWEILYAEVVSRQRFHSGPRRNRRK